MDKELTLDQVALNANKNIIARDYWRTRMAGFELADYFNVYDGPVIPSEIDAEGVYTVEVAVEIQRVLDEIAKSEKAKHIIFMATLAILSSKYASVEDVCLFTPIYWNELSSDIDNELVPVRIKDFSFLSFPAFLKITKENILQDFKHGDYPIRMIVNNINEDIHAISSIGLSIEGLQRLSAFDSLPSDLLFLFNLEDPLTLTIKYRSSKFDHKWVGQLAELYLNLLYELLRNRERTIGEVEIILERDRNKVLYEFNKTIFDYKTKETIVSLIEKQAELIPLKSAVKYDNCTLSYQEVNGKANTLAHILKRKSKPGCKYIPILMNKCLELPVAMLSILKCGLAYVPLDISWPIARIKEIVEELESELLLVNDYGWKLVAEDQFLKHIATEVKAEALAAEGPNPTIPVNLRSPFFVVYTSGSTGKPKGAINHHEGILNRFLYMNKRYGIRPDDVILMTSNTAFDSAAWQLLWPLTNGARTVIPIQDERFDLFGIIDLIEKEKITITDFVPSVFNLMVDHLVANEEEMIHKFKSLRQLIIGGEAMSAKHIYKFKKSFPDVSITNAYGPSEASIGTVFYEVPLEKLDPVPIGKPIDNVICLVLNKDKNLMPFGAVGELYLGGICTGLGYLKDPERTKQSFVKLNYSSYESCLFYKTGDLVRYLPDGNLSYIGRIDNQVKIRGLRIELGEIERKLLIDERVKETIVTTKGENENKYLVAYYVANDQIEGAEIKSFLAKDLPEYMIPSFFIYLKTFPLTSNGKLDRKALPDPSFKGEDEYVSPNNTTEEKLVEIWAGVLKLNEEQISVKKSFFELGGHSLKATIAVNRIFKELNVEISLRQFFQYQNIRSIAELVENEESTKYDSIKKAPVKDYYELSSVQKRLYFLHHFDKSSTVYNMPTILNVKGAFDQDKLKRAFSSLIQRHEILRTDFILIDGSPVQKIESETNFEVEFYHGGNLDIEGKIKEFRKPFDISQSPLVRVGLIKRGEADHILMIDTHHLISDGVSHHVLLNELIVLYNGGELEQVELQYKDFVEWQCNNAQRNKIIKQQEYWLNVFSTPPTMLNLPTDFKRPSQKNFEGDSAKFVLDLIETEALRTLAKAEGVSLYMMILAIYNVFLSKIGNIEDITTGTIVRGRQHPELEKTIGMFANTLAMRNKPSANLEFTTFLAEVKSNTIQCLDNQAYQYEDLVDKLKLERNTSRNPLFDVFFVFENFEQIEWSIPELEISSFDTEYKLAKFDLTLMAYELEHMVNLEFEYSTELFKEKTINRFIQFFKQIVTQLIVNPNINISQIEIVDKIEKVKILDDYNLTQFSYPSGKTIIDVFEEQAICYFDKVAIEFDGRSVTYRELNESANRLAHYLINQGLKTNTIVGLFIDRSIEMIISILAILKAGAAYLPIDIDSPKDRTKLLLDDCQASLLITTSDIDCRLDDSFNKIFVDQVSIEAYDKENPKVLTTGRDLCYVIYTSGTTGKPKGVMVDHRNLMNLFFNEAFYFKFNADDVWTMFHRYCFDFSVWEMYGALLFGGKLVIVSKENSIDPFELLRILKNSQVTVLSQTPTAFNNLIQQEILDDLPVLKLRYVIFGGEALNPKILIKWSNRYPDTKLINMFGITETTVHVTYKEITHQDILSNKSNIGRPLPGFSTYLLDKDLNVVPLGFPGELYVGGGGVARGYINNVELTHEKFIKNPYQKDDRLYKSGDLVKVIEEGDLEYKGRIDSQIQLKGFRIELEEIENALTKYRFIKEARVLFREMEEQSFLIAYYIADYEIASSQLRKILSETLPLYMVPSYFVKIDSLPITVNGKIDTLKLPNPKVVIGKEYALASTKNEVMLLEIWMKILGLAEMGITDNYFVLGGDSIMAIRLITAINNKTSGNIKVIDLYNHQTIKELAGYMDHGEEEDVKLEYAEVEEELRLFQHNYLKNRKDERIEVVYPMSNIEKGMCYVHLKNPEEILYYEQLVWPVYYKDFDKEIVKRAVYLLCQKHAALRTAFDLAEFAHIIYKIIPIDIPYSDISYLNQAEQETAIKAYMEKSRVNHFALENAPLWKMSIYKIGDDNHVIIFEIHHAISDGWSIATFMNELNNAYNELLINPDYVPLALKTGYKDFIVDEMVCEKNEEYLNYWKKELDGFKKYSFGVSAKEKQYISTRIPFEYSLYEKLESLALTRKSKVKNIFFAAYIYALKMLTYENDIVVGLVTFNRSIGEDGDQVFGNFLNTVPVRIKMEKKITPEQLMDLIDEKLLEVKKYDKSSLFNINKAIGAVGYGENPITDLLFNFTDFHSSYELHLEKVSIESKVSLDVKAFVRGHSLFDVNINGTKGDLFIHYEYLSSFLDEELFDKFRLYFNKILSLFTSSYKEELEVMSIIGNEESSKMINTFNNTESAFPVDKTIVDLFTEVSSGNPDKIAVIVGKKVFTYGELDKKSTSLAAYIRKKGIRPGSIIGISLERSFEMMIGIMGILKANCAYLPIDPNNPIERNSYMLHDTNVELLLTQRRFIADFGSFVNILDLEDEKIYENISSKVDKRSSSPNDLAYVIYTSGSTGKPKGVAINHKSVVNRLNWMQKAYPIDGNDVVLQKTPFTFDVSVWELFWWSLQGAKLVMLEPNGEKDPEQIVHHIIVHKVSIIHFVPSMLSVFLDHLGNSDFAFKPLSSLRYVFCSGEALAPYLVGKFNQLLVINNTKLINLYGPTEATVDVTYFNCDSDSELSQVPIGKPIDNTKIYILDKNNHVLPLGVTGELCIAGVGIARGYINKVELTHEKFILNPIDKNGFVYKTGDLARWDKEGNLEYIGRMDDQVKIRGNRIELGEIESVLLSFPGISGGAVLIKDVDNESKIIGYYTAKENYSTLTIRTFLRKKLPEYMIPFKLIQIERMPLTPNGKLNKKELLEFYDKEPKKDHNLNEFFSPLQEKIAKIWMNETNVESVRMDDVFFDIGGNSLSAIKAAAKIKEAYGVEPDLAGFFYQSFRQFVHNYEIRLGGGNEVLIKSKKLDPGS